MPPTEKTKGKALITRKLLSEFTFLLRKNTGITFGEGYLQFKIALFRLLDKHSEDEVRKSLSAFFLDSYAIENCCPWQLFVKQFERYLAKSANLKSVIPIPELLNKYWKNENTGKMYEEIKDSPTPKEKIVELRVERDKLGTIADVSLEDVERYIAKIAFIKGKDNVSEAWITAYVNRVRIFRDRKLYQKEEVKAKQKTFLKTSLTNKIAKKEACKKDFQEFFNLYFGFRDPLNREIQEELEVENGVKTIGSKRFKYDFIETVMVKHGYAFVEFFKDCKTLNEYVALYEGVEKEIHELKRKYRNEILDYLLPEEVEIYE